MVYPLFPAFGHDLQVGSKLTQKFSKYKCTKKETVSRVIITELQNYKNRGPDVLILQLFEKGPYSLNTPRHAR